MTYLHFLCLFLAACGSDVENGTQVGRFVVEQGDWNAVWERKAQAGDTILMHAGLYQSDRLNYVDPQMTAFDGTMSLTLKATPGKPITIKSVGDGEVIFDGAGNVIPTVNDGFTGRAPDLGALEVNVPVPTYGPRWLKGQPFYR